MSGTEWPELTSQGPFLKRGGGGLGVKGGEEVRTLPSSLSLRRKRGKGGKLVPDGDSWWRVEGAVRCVWVRVGQ